jgi:monofunctional biosynthetic peptidoglycan transglycosylase
MKALAQHLLRLCGVFILALLALQLYFVLRIGLMTVVDPASTSFQRSEVVRLLVEKKQDFNWRQSWVPYSGISVQLKRAVIASEDAKFADHSGVEWDAIEKAWERNVKAQEKADQRNQQLEKRNVDTRIEAKLVGGSTITQQLAKNLFLSGERSLPRKAQEFLITGMLEALLTKQRILEIYLNHVEWGEGVFGAQAAAQHYFGQNAAALSTLSAARLAVMLPAPKRFEKRPQSAYVSGRASTVVARMGAVEVP